MKSSKRMFAVVPFKSKTLSGALGALRDGDDKRETLYGTYFVAVFHRRKDALAMAKEDWPDSRIVPVIISDCQ